MAQAKKTTGAVVVKKAQIAVAASVRERFDRELATVKARLSAPSGDRITVTQGKKFKLPDGRTHEGPLDAIIVDFVSFYTLYDKTYDPNGIEPPKCFSLGMEPAGLVPSPNSAEMQSESCAACWANQFGSASVGKGKACNNSRLLALLDPNGDEKTPLMLLKVSATALRGFDGYVANVIRAFGVPVRGVLTEIDFNPDVDYASLTFGNPRPLDDDLLLLADSRQEEALERLLTEPTYNPPTEAAPAPAKTRAPAKAAPRRAAARA